MIVKVLGEYGREEALLGLSLSFYDHKENLENWWDSDKIIRADRRAKALAFKGMGHNKFIASMGVWLYIQAPRCWFSEWDTYKVGVTANSSSTMHTISNRVTTKEDYELGTSYYCIEAFNRCLEEYKNPNSLHYKDISRLKCNLPEGWLQERQVSTNYMSLQNIIRQREGHRLKYWSTFIDSILEQVEHPELLKETE
jgi:hypothetical protein